MPTRRGPIPCSPTLPDSKLSRSKVIALDKATGEPVWETARPFNRSAWSSPMTWKHEHGTDLVVLGNGRACGYAPFSATPAMDRNSLYVRTDTVLLTFR
jgi:hypothetical protein